MQDFKGKVAIVTGGGRDIGRWCSVKLAERGAKVCVNYNSSEKEANETLEMIRKAGGEGIAVQADLTKPEEVKKLVDETRKAFGEHIHVLVNNAGGLVGRRTMDELDIEFWNHVINLNLGSTFMTTKEALPFMPVGGAIVNLSSQAARDGGGAGSTAYSASKGAILTFTKSLAKELGPKKIRVNAVSPGLINTTFHDTFTKPEAREKVAGSAPLRREGEAPEVADLAVYLASEQASYITGASVEINGGTYFI